MKQYLKIHSSTRPQDVVFTGSTVQVNSNIVSYSETIDEHIIEGFEYDCTEYTKDEYLMQQDSKIASLQDELEAAKILLGVD